jgi:hypothetical protein
MALRELRLRVPRSLIIEVVALPLPLRSAVEGARYCEICFQIGLVFLILFAVSAVLMLVWTAWFALGTVVGLVVAGVSFQRSMNAASYDLPDQPMAFTVGLVEALADAAPELPVGLTLRLSPDGALPERPPEQLAIELLSAWPAIHGNRHVVRLPWLRLCAPAGADAGTPRLTLYAARWFDNGGELVDSRRTGARQSEAERAVQSHVHEVLLLHGDDLPSELPQPIERFSRAETAERAGGAAELWRGEATSPSDASFDEATGRALGVRLLGWLTPEN